MPCFRCSKCGCVENTAACNYWNKEKGKALCSECDPEIKKWHGRFPKESAKGMMQSQRGFLYSKEELAPGGYFSRPHYQEAEGPFEEIKE